jgi:DNA-binding GntR family transcriptional regulator
MAARKGTPTAKGLTRGRTTRSRSAPRESAQPAPHDPEVFEVHRQFVEVMEDGRLLAIGAEMRGHYLTVMRSLTAKLSIPGKPLSEIVSEMMTEAAPIIFKVMQQ